jgi:hypothetical protein
MARRRARVERCCALIICSFVACSGCATPAAETPQVQETPVKSAAVNGDPMVAALLWTTTKSVEDDQELETIVTSWEDPQVLRVFRDGGVYRAVIADGPQDELRQAAILTIDRVEGLWAVTHVESGRSDLLWPGY